MQQLWNMVETRGRVMAELCPEWVKLAKLTITLIPGSVEDERTFSGLNFIHSDLRSRLVNPHLSNALRLFLQSKWSVDEFPYDIALRHWHNAAELRGRYTKN